MKKTRLKLGLILSLTVVIGFLSSCGEEEGCTIQNMEGTYIGFYSVLGFDFPNPDTVTVTSNGVDEVTLTSTLLRTSFTANYDDILNEANIDGDDFGMVDTLFVGSQYFANISIGNANVRLDQSCGNLYIDINQASVADGTIDIPLRDPDYPINNVNLSTAGSGLERQ